MRHQLKYYICDSIEKMKYLQPEFFIKSTCNNTSLKQHHDSFLCTILYLKIQVFSPILQLSLLKWFHMEIGTANLKDITHFQLVRLHTVILMKYWIGIIRRAHISMILNIIFTHPFLEAPSFADFLLSLRIHFFPVLNGLFFD